MTSKGGKAVELAIELAPTSVKSFGAGTGGGAQQRRSRPSRPGAQGLKKDRIKPIILIDAGHGGIDPVGGASNLKEKTLVLAWPRLSRRNCRRPAAMTCG